MTALPLIVFDVNETVLDLETMESNKPSPQAYVYVEKELGVKPSQLCLIACHTWDTLGAIAAGWETALIERVGNDVLGVGPQPQIVGNDLNDVVDQFIARHRRPADQPDTSVAEAGAQLTPPSKGAVL